MAQSELGRKVLVLRADSASVAAQMVLAQALQAHYGQLDIAFLRRHVPGHTESGRKAFR